MTTSGIKVHLLPHAEKLAPPHDIPIRPEGAMLLYHQYRTYEALKTHSLVVNTYNTGTGKTRAALLRLLDPDATGANMLFIAPTNELIAQHRRDIQGFVEMHGLDYHVIPVDAHELRTLPTPHEHERVGERLNRLIRNPQEYGWRGQKPVAIVTNPDIFYYVLYFSAYNPHDRRNLFERFMLDFNYVVIDEFHYYTPKQLATFLFYFTLCREWGYFDKLGRKICLLSATPERHVTDYLRHIFADAMALISPDTEPPDSASLPTTPTLAPTALEIRQETLDDYVAEPTTQARLAQWITRAGLDGALISSALWRINRAYAALRPSLDGQMARITGAEKVEQRRSAPTYPLILATPTVDIGYNFNKPNKARQPIDFVTFDARTRDQFLQRLGRAGRVLGKAETSSPAHAIALINTDEATWKALQALDGKTLERRAFSEAINNTLPARGDFYSYMDSYGMAEMLRPLFNLKQTLRPDLEDWLRKLFDSVREVFSPGNPRWTFASIDGVMKRANLIEQASIAIRRDRSAMVTLDGKTTARLLEGYAEWRKWQLSPDQFEKLAQGIKAGNRRVLDALVAWIESQHALNEALFSFRDALPAPSACAFDPKHLLASDDVTVYDALHIAANYDVEWFEDAAQFEQRTGRYAEPTPPYGQMLFGFLRDHRSVRLKLIFDYHADADAGATRDDFETLFCHRVVAIKGLNLRAEVIGKRGAPFPMDPQVTRVFRDVHVPLLLVRQGTLESAVLYSRLRDTNIFVRSVGVTFADGTQQNYAAVVGSAAFDAYAELERFFFMSEKKRERSGIIV